jgi:hypothetical protein
LIQVGLAWLPQTYERALNPRSSTKIGWVRSHIIGSSRFPSWSVTALIVPISSGQYIRLETVVFKCSRAALDLATAGPVQTLAVGERLPMVDQFLGNLQSLWWIECRKAWRKL